MSKSYIGKPTGWSKEYSQTKRRRIVLESRNGNYKLAAQAMLSKYRDTSNREAKRKLWSDYLYFKKKANGNGKKP